MATAITTKTQAQARVKKLFEAIQVFEHAVGQMEVDGWFGGGPEKGGISTCVVSDHNGYTTKSCADGGPVCAGIAIFNAAAQRCSLRRWNKDRSKAYVNRHLDLFVELAEVNIGLGDPRGVLRSIPHWNDRDGVNYDAVKAAFGVALRKLTEERYSLSQQFGIALSGAVADGNSFTYLSD